MSTEAHRLADIVRSKDPLDSLCKERLITHEACDWLKSALDPFHDFQLDNLKGYPDISTEPTVVVQVRQSKTISAPPGLVDGHTWDCHFALSPVDYAQPGPSQSSTIRGCRVEPGTGDHAGAVSYISSEHGGSPLCARMDGLLISSSPTEGLGASSMTFTPGHCLAATSTSDLHQLQGIHLDDFVDFAETDLGVYRIIYSGFEVVNTTAQIAKQGSVTVYEYGNSYEVASKYDSSTGALSSAPNTYFRCPPNTLAEAKIMPGAHTWAAQDGCYNTAKFQTDNPFQSATQRNFTFSQNNDYAPTGSGYLTASPSSTNEDYGSFASNNSMADGPSSFFAPTTHFSRMNTTGAYFTGLSSQTSLFVTWRVGIERLPSANRPMFLALAQPSAAYDPNALVLYNLVANALPPGCPQGYNDIGKWFSWIVSKAKQAIPTVYPIVRTAAMVAGVLGRPLLAGALSGAAASMKPVAEDMAAKRLQNAARRRANSNGQSGKKPAVGNYTKPSPRGQVRGGTNGLR